MQHASAGFLLSVLFLSFWTAAVESRTVELDPFTAIRDCLPFNVLVQPSDEDVYSLTMRGNNAVMDVVMATVENGVLTLGLDEGFETENAIRAIVTVPRGALERITKSSTSVLVVAPGLNVTRLRIVASGVAAVRVFDAVITNLVVEGEGTSVVFAQGRIRSATFNVENTARVYCYGLRRDATVNAAGIGRVFINAQNPNVVIEGRVDGLGRVLITDGECDVAGSILRSGCETINEDTLPEFEATFSCGLIVDGRISCSRGGTGASATTYTSSQVDGTSASAIASTSGSATASAGATTTTSGTATTSTTTDGTATTSTTTDGTTTTTTSTSTSSSDPRFESLVSTQDSNGGEAVAVAATACVDEDLDMFDDE